MTAKRRDLFRRLVTPKRHKINEYSRSLITLGINVSEIKEWHMELRDNEVSMGEENVKAKKKKLDHEEQSLEEQVAYFIYFWFL